MAETLIPGLRRLLPEPDRGPWQAPALYLLGDDRLTLIDAGYDSPEGIERINTAIGGVSLERVLLTHVHIDHAGGAWALRERTGAQVWAHRDEAPALERRFPGRRIDRWIEPGETIIAGDFTLEALLTPGHAAGHLCFFDRGRGVLFSGDLVTGAGSSLIVPPEGNLTAYMDSLRRVRELPVTLLLPGHGPERRDPAARIDELIEHRKLRELCLAGCLWRGGPMTLSELTRAMYYGLIHPHLEGVAAGTASAHLEKLIAEGKVESNEEGPLTAVFGLTDRGRAEAEAIFAPAPAG